jgi:hypothetical protein
MENDLHRLVRSTYNRACHQHRDTTAAFKEAVEALMRSRPMLSGSEARYEVAVMIATEPAGLRHAGAELS